MPRQKSFRVYVGGLSREAGVKDIEHFFRRYRRRFDVMLKERFAFLVSNRKTSVNENVSPSLLLTVRVVHL